MKLSEFKNHLQNLEEINILQPNGEKIPSHFHITEIGKVNKNFMDCGGKMRSEYAINFQIWKSVDTWHRLSPSKLLNIIQLSEEKLGIEDGEIEVEFQGETIGKYHLSFNNNTFQLLNTKTDCLAKENCGIPLKKIKKNLSELSLINNNSCCSTDSSCC